MTAPIVLPFTRQPAHISLAPEARVSGLAAIARRDFDNPPKGQLWERLAEVTLEDVQWRRIYFPKLRGAMNRALRRSDLRRATSFDQECGDIDPVIPGGACRLANGHDDYHRNAAGFFWTS